MGSYAMFVPMKPVGKQRPRVSKSHAYTLDQTGKAEENIRDAFLMKHPGFEPLSGPVVVEVMFITFSAKAKPSRGIGFCAGNPIVPNASKPDLDNMVKLVLDALNGLAWKDDAQICECHSFKVLTEKEEEEGIMLRFMEVDGC